MTKFLIDFVNTATQEEIDTYLLGIGATVIKSFNAFQNFYFVECNETPALHEIVDHIINDEHHTIKLLDTSFIMDKSSYKVVTDGTHPTIDIDINDEKNWWKVYSLSEVDFDATDVVINRKGRGTVIYLVDSGVSLTLPEFEDADISNLFTFNGDYTDTRGHGTALASIMVGKTCGISAATVKSVKIFDESTTTMISDIMSAFDAIYNDYQTNTYDKYIVNMSWGIDKNEYIENKIRQLMSNGIFCVAAAGNSGIPISDITPASMPEVLTIGSYNNDLIPSDFTNYTEDSAVSYTAGTTNHGALDGFAPGEKIWVATLDGGYGFAAGTSFSAAIQSAAIAYTASTYYLPVDFFDTSRVYYLDVGLSRRNILDLSDPKYASSENRVTTFRNTRRVMSTMADYYEEYYVKAGNKRLLHLINITLIKKVEFSQPLPEGVTFFNNGVMTFVCPETLSNDYEFIYIPYTVTYENDTTENANFRLCYYRPTTEWAEESFIDAPVTINLYDAGAGCEFDCFPDCTIGGCVGTKTPCYCDF